MNSPFLGEALILVLLIFNCSRIFFIKYGRIDSLSVLTPICVVLSIMQIIAWNVDSFSLLLLVVSIFAFFLNFRSLLRFASGLYVDHYSVAFKIGAIITLLISIAELVALVYFRPVFIEKSKFDSKVQKVRLTGSFARGFLPSTTFEPSSATVWIIQPENEENLNGGIVALQTDKRAEISDYLPYAYHLAKMGFKVYTADFFARDLKWIHTLADFRGVRRLYEILMYFKNPVQFELEREFYTYNSMKEMDALLKFIQENEKTSASPSELSSTTSPENTVASSSETPFKNPAPILFVGDWMAKTALSDFEKLNKNSICGVFDISEQEEISTPGFGFVEQTRPLVAFFLKKERNLDLSKIEALAQKTATLIPIPEKKVDTEEKLTEDDSDKSGGA